MMKMRTPPLWVCTALLGLALLWRLLGAPVSAADFAALGTPVWQARILLPSRAEHVFRLWLPAPQTAAETLMDEESVMPDAQQVMLQVYLSDEGRMARMSLEGYVCGVVAAEMPAAYHMEALKAQAVAARTRVVRQMQQGGCALHPGADICTDSAHCQGYAAPAECKQRWDTSYEAYRNRILQAGAETRDEIITYEGEAITVLYHAISGGRTEDAQTVFAHGEPYLVSVESTGEENVRGYQQDTAYTYEQLIQMIRTAFGRDLTAEEIRQTLAIGSYTPSGRAATILLGGETYEATAFRKALALRSTWFSLSMDQEEVVFHQRGYGHGVGMSQAGANSMAAAGYTYSDILMHYYPGVLIGKE